jgi:hypothetical protein
VSRFGNIAKERMNYGRKVLHIQSIRFDQQSLSETICKQLRGEIGIFSSAATIENGPYNEIASVGNVEVVLIPIGMRKAPPRNKRSVNHNVNV